LCIAVYPAHPPWEDPHVARPPVARPDRQHGRRSVRGDTHVRRQDQRVAAHRWADAHSAFAADGVVPMPLASGAGQDGVRSKCTRSSTIVPPSTRITVTQASTRVPRDASAVAMMNRQKHWSPTRAIWSTVCRTHGSASLARLVASTTLLRPRIAELLLKAAGVLGEPGATAFGVVGVNRRADLVHDRLPPRGLVGHAVRSGHALFCSDRPKRVMTLAASTVYRPGGSRGSGRCYALRLGGELTSQRAEAPASWVAVCPHARERAGHGAWRRAPMV
jgi:hypothetical protein